MSLIMLGLTITWFKIAYKSIKGSRAFESDDIRISIRIMIVLSTLSFIVLYSLLDQVPHTWLSDIDIDKLRVVTAFLGYSIGDSVGILYLIKRRKTSSDQ